MRVESDGRRRSTRDERNGPGYPFSLDEKLGAITEPHPWYTPDGGRRRRGAGPSSRWR